MDSYVRDSSQKKKRLRFAREKSKRALCRPINNGTNGLSERPTWPGALEWHEFFQILFCRIALLFYLGLIASQSSMRLERSQLINKCTAFAVIPLKYSAVGLSSESKQYFPQYFSNNIFLRLINLTSVAIIHR